MKKLIYFCIVFCCVVANAQDRIEVLEEVIVTKQLLPKHDFHKKFKGKKYFTFFLGSSSIVSVHKNKKATDLVGFKLEIDASVLSSEDFVVFRPVILFEDLSEVRSFKKEFRLEENTKEIIFSFSENPIALEENKNYLIGIEILDKNQTNKSIKIRALNQKGFYSMQKNYLKSDWLKQENSPHGYTLDYELFFRK